MPQQAPYDVTEVKVLYKKLFGLYITKSQEKVLVKIDCFVYFLKKFLTYLQFRSNKELVNLNIKYYCLKESLRKSATLSSDSLLALKNENRSLHEKFNKLDAAVLNSSNLLQKSDFEIQDLLKAIDSKSFKINLYAAFSHICNGFNSRCSNFLQNSAGLCSSLRRKSNYDGSLNISEVLTFFADEFKRTPELDTSRIPSNVSNYINLANGKAYVNNLSRQSLMFNQKFLKSMQSLKCCEVNTSQTVNHNMQDFICKHLSKNKYKYVEFFFRERHNRRRFAKVEEEIGFIKQAITSILNSSHISAREKQCMLLHLEIHQIYFSEAIAWLKKVISTIRKENLDLRTHCKKMDEINKRINTFPLILNKNSKHIELLIKHNKFCETMLVERPRNIAKNLNEFSHSSLPYLINPNVASLLDSISVNDDYQYLVCLNAFLKLRNSSFVQVNYLYAHLPFYADANVSVSRTFLTVVLVYLTKISHQSTQCLSIAPRSLSSIDELISNLISSINVYHERSVNIFSLSIPKLQNLLKVTPNTFAKLFDEVTKDLDICIDQPGQYSVPWIKVLSLSVRDARKRLTML